MDFIVFTHHEGSETRICTDKGFLVLIALCGFYSGDSVCIAIRNSTYNPRTFSGTAGSKECHDWLNARYSTGELK